MTDDLAIDSAFRRVIETVDNEWSLLRSGRRADSLRPRLDTLSESLADPFEKNRIEEMLLRTFGTAETMDDRLAVLTLAGAAHVQGLINADALERLTQEFEKR
jgi:hypothetical protein